MKTSGPKRSAIDDHHYEKLTWERIDQAATDDRSW